MKTEIKNRKKIKSGFVFIHSTNTIRNIKNVREGLDYSVFDEFKNQFDFTVKELAENLNISVKTLDRRKSKKENLNSIESEKLIRLGRIFNKAISVFENDEHATKWMKEKNPYLNNNSPLSFCDTQFGGEEVYDLLGRIEHGVFA